ncbi:unnamed protein product [Microthlaspi erraticum]|uniref:Reverse transcriptase domain-containing protein n=1 Tax=Microthlaspi erraticum TaxID=1685480 RepID=A0A6D2L4Q6_9BRAS|nr:unnamed protein product [Microthlaspi erraticum]
MWLRDGDLNTKFFHVSTKQRRAVNRIVGLHNEANVWVAGEKEVEKIAVSYFDKLFTSDSPVDFTGVLEHLSERVTPLENNVLTRQATETEVREALFMMHPEKAPGPDGMTTLFFQRSWHIVKEEVLCQRLKVLLPRLISETQSAFVPGRLISDNILIAQEMFHGLRTNKSCKGKFMAVKTDMSKAYDRVEWKFIEALMRKMGFAEHWILLMMRCITSVQYKVLLNGQPKGRIIPQRELRQGDPLSPYLFILCTEVLKANLNKAEDMKRITGLKMARASPAVSHILFADDSLFFCRASAEESQVLIQILKEYETTSGQQINMGKSSVQFGHTVDLDVRREIHQNMGITTVEGVGSYLGIPDSLGGAKTKIFSFLVERQNQRINGWNSKWLSKGGKKVLIKSVASAMPTHVMSCFRLPKGITNKLSGAVSNFWWSNSGQSRGIHWLAWSKLCRQKKDGDLGFRVIEDFNTALLAKQLWRLMDYPESLFARVFKGRYYRNSTPLDNIRSYSPSYGWQSIVSARPLNQPMESGREGCDTRGLQAQAPTTVPNRSLFSNMAYLFWELPNDDRMRMYPWLIWYIWKARNDKVLGNVDWDPNDIITKATAESLTWAKAQEKQETEIHDYRLQWKPFYRVTGVKWMEHGRRQIVGLAWDGITSIQIHRMVSKPEEWPAFAILLEKVDKCKMGFTSFSIVHIPRMNNTKADKLARSARALPTDVYYVNSVSPAWIPELL